MKHLFELILFLCLALTLASPEVKKQSIQPRYSGGAGRVGGGYSGTPGTPQSRTFLLSHFMNKFKKGGGLFGGSGLFGGNKGGGLFGGGLGSGLFGGGLGSGLFGGGLGSGLFGSRYQQPYRPPYAPHGYGHTPFPSYGYPSPYGFPAPSYGYSPYAVPSPYGFPQPVPGYGGVGVSPFASTVHKGGVHAGPPGIPTYG